MRIIAGEYRGRMLAALGGLAVRPTTDRVRQSVFDILSTRVDFDGIKVLDLFSGSGSLGLEAISRGAASATLVDSSRKSLHIAEKNARILGCLQKCTLHEADVFWYLKNSKNTFDLVFADPPFKLERIVELPERLYESRVLGVGKYFVMEHSKESNVETIDTHFEITKKAFGQTTVLILEKTSSATS
ncbi:MAG: 16S rRNA (guanine(966)-N(2))-methyltransferase RsmD [Ignavibacteriales bacterium]|nr:16S rRNA (guanine(966)-N(2))-methyltransferase RsmD [Ignavibacteriales bacterium]